MTVPPCNIREPDANHFNRPLSLGVSKWLNSETVKAKLNLKVSASMTGGGHRQWASRATVICRADIEHVHDFAREHCSGRDYLIVRLPMKVGLRTGEIASLRIDNIDFDTRSFQVLDSKQKVLYPLPLDVVSLQLIQDLIRDRLEGYVFTHDRTWKNVKAELPLSDQEIWHIINKIGLDAGVPGLKPRTFRQYFVAKWICDHRTDDTGLSKKVLQLILRHKNSSTTDVYADSKIFFEDIQREFDGVRNDPVIAGSVCSDCAIRAVCKFADRMPSCAAACHFKVTKKEVE